VTTSRLTRVEQVERNRARLLDAARRVFLARGYGGATLEAIADEAGFSKGVVYSQFAGKPDLFLALVRDRIAERAQENRRIVEEHAGLDAALSLLRLNARHAEVEADWTRLIIEFRVIAARDPELTARYAALHADTVDQLAEAISTGLTRGGLTTAVPARTFAQLVLALSTGAVLEQAAEPAALPIETAADVLCRLIVPA
jgi:AcrR family transcriptional regulator